MPEKREITDLSVEELERLLLVKRREARLKRVRQLPAKNNRIDVGQLKNIPVTPTAHDYSTASSADAGAGSFAETRITTAVTRKHVWRDRLLLGIEVLAVVGLISVFISSYISLHLLNQEVVVARENAPKLPTPTATALITLQRLPGGHSSPNSPQGALPDIPSHLQAWVQPAPAIPVPTPAVGQPTRLVIPKINLDAAIVEGVNWDDLKQGVGHLPGSAYPGERGNMYLAAHNDIYGEIFRYLEKLTPGDVFTVFAGEKSFNYVVKERKITEPTDVSVMLPTTKPVATLQTCYPYLVDNQRLVIIGELVN